MDPATILGVAAAAAQFTELAFKITKRVANYASRSIDLPPELNTINHRLKSLQGCVPNIHARLLLAKRGSSIEPGRLRDLNEFIKDLTRRCAELESLFERYLPDDEDTRIDRVVKGIQSLSKDKDISALAQAMSEDSIILMLNLATLDSPEPERSHGEPSNNQVLAMVPMDRRVHDPVIRRDILDQINLAFAASENDEPHVAILQGMGGQGKTQLALEYCRQSKRARKYQGVFWVDAAEEAMAIKAIAGIAQRLNPEKLFANDDGRVEFVKDALGSWNVPWLLVFDNYDDPKNYTIQKFFPASALGDVLITTRSPALSRLGRRVEVHGLDETQGLQLLFSQCEIERTKETETHGRAIIARLGYLPLAIAQAGAYLGETRDTVKIGDFLGIYEARMQEILSTTPEVWVYINHAESGTQQNHIKNVFTTWDFSLRLLERGHHAEEKRHLLSVMAFFAISDVSEVLFESYFQSFSGDRPSWLRLFDERGAWSTSRYADVMIELKKLSLISTNTRREDDGRIHVSLHPLVRDWILLKLKQSGSEDLYLETASRVLGQALLRFRADTDCFEEAEFSMDLALRAEILSHISVWNKHMEGKTAENLCHVVTFDSGGLPLSFQWVVAEFLYDCGSDDYVSHLLWVWDHCTSEEALWPTIRSLAVTIFSSRMCRDTTDPAKRLESIRTTREALRIVEDHRCEAAIDFVRWELTNCLLITQSPEDIKEARGILQDLIRTAQTPSRRFQFMAKLAELLGRTKRLTDQEQANVFLRSIYEESEVAEDGGAEYRRKFWCSLVWWRCMDSLPDAGAREKLCRERLQHFESQRAKAAEMNHFHYLGSKLQLGMLLLETGRFDEAVGEFEACVVAQEGSKGEIADVMFGSSLCLLGVAYLRAGRPKDAVSVLLRSIDVALRSVTTNFTILHTTADHLTDAFEQLGDFEGVCFAAHTRLEALAKHGRQGPDISERLIQAHLAAASGKGWNRPASSITRSTVDEVAGHFDAAIAALHVGLRQQKALDAELKEEEQDPRILSGLLGDDNDASLPETYMERFGWTPEELHLHKATHLAVHGLYERAVASFEASKTSFEVRKETDTDWTMTYLDNVWTFLAYVEVIDRGSDFVQDTIVWACEQARGRLGDTKETGEVVQHGILKLSGCLMNNLPVDEPYMARLLEIYLSSLPPSTLAPNKAKKSAKERLKGLFRKSGQA